MKTMALPIGDAGIYTNSQGEPMSLGIAEVPELKPQPHLEIRTRELKSP